MIDTVTRKPLHVSDAETVWPTITLPFSQLTEVCQLLDENRIPYWVDEHIISMDGGPEIAMISFGRAVDGRAVQTVLDSMP